MHPKALIAVAVFLVLLGGIIPLIVFTLPAKSSSNAINTPFVNISLLNATT